jgi:hypothetical protein
MQWGTPYTIGTVVKPQFYLVGETDPRRIEPGTSCRWTRIYAPVFPDYSDFELYNATYPGLGTGTAGVSSRNPFTIPIHSELRSRFFLVGVSNSDVTPFAKITQFSDIQIFRPLPIVGSGGVLDTYDGAINFDISSIVNFFPDANSNGTTKTEAEYLAKVALATPYGTTASPYGYMMVAEGSVIKRWRGDLYERVTRYVRAY